LIVVSGCSGGGKSTLLDELGRRGFQVQPEPGRQIVKEQSLIGGAGLPWEDTAQFVELCASRSMYFYNSVRLSTGTRAAVFDRSLVDGVAGLERSSLAVPDHLRMALQKYRYAERVFLTPPWQELFVADAERQHSFADAVAEYEHLLIQYPAYGYEVVVLPKIGVQARADFFEAQLGEI
jgi:predicted ATPase